MVRGTSAIVFPIRWSKQTQQSQETATAGASVQQIRRTKFMAYIQTKITKKLGLALTAWSATALALGAVITWTLFVVITWTFMLRLNQPDDCLEQRDIWACFCSLVSNSSGIMCCIYMNLIVAITPTLMLWLHQPDSCLEQTDIRQSGQRQLWRYVLWLHEPYYCDYINLNVVITST